MVINVDEAVSHGHAVAVMGELREIEGATLGIATKQDATGSLPLKIQAIEAAVLGMGLAIAVMTSRLRHQKASNNQDGGC